MSDEIPLKLSAHAKVVKLEYSLAVGEYGGDSLRFGVNPISASIGKNIFTALDEWADSVRPSRWVALWRAERALHWLLFWVGLVLLALGVPTHSTSYESLLTKDAINLVGDGITEEEIPEAVRILVMKTFGLCPTDFRLDAGAYWAKAMVLLGLLLAACVLLSFPPPEDMSRTWADQVFGQEVAGLVQVRCRYRPDCDGRGSPDTQSHRKDAASASALAGASTPTHHTARTGIVWASGSPFAAQTTRFPQRTGPLLKEPPALAGGSFL